MLWQILKNEWRMLSRDKTLGLMTLILAACTAYALFNGISWCEKRAATVQQYIDEAEKALAEQRQLVAEIETNGKTLQELPNAGLPQRASYVAALPPGPLSAFAIGQADLYPYQATISIWGRQDNLFRNYQIDSPMSLLAGKFDFSFVIIYLLPLLIIGISFHLLSAEKESGTLAMALSQPLPLARLISGKVLLRLTLVTGAVLALGIIGGLVSGIASAAGDATARFILWLIFAGFYAWFWFALSALVNAFGKSSEANATILVCAWLLLVLIVPAVLNLAINQASPVPSRFEYVSAMRAAENAAQLKSSELLSEYYHDHPELVTEEKRSDFIARYFATQRNVENTVMPVTRDYEARLAHQQGLVRSLRFISPAVMLQEAFNDIAGSGMARQQEYIRQVRPNLTDWQTFLSPKLFRKEQLTTADFDALPRFGFREESLSSVAARVWPAFFGLAVPTMLFWVWGIIRLKRYHVSE